MEYDDVLEHLIDNNMDQYRFNKKSMLVHAWSEMHLNAHTILSSMSMTDQFVATSQALATYGAMSEKDSHAILDYMEGILKDPFLKEKLPFQRLSDHALAIKPLLEHPIIAHATKDLKKDKTCSLRKM